MQVEHGQCDCLHLQDALLTMPRSVHLAMQLPILSEFEFPNLLVPLYVRVASLFDIERVGPDQFCLASGDALACHYVCILTHKCVERRPINSQLLRDTQIVFNSDPRSHCDTSPMQVTPLLVQAAALARAITPVKRLAAVASAARAPPELTDARGTVTNARCPCRQRKGCHRIPSPLLPSALSSLLCRVMNQVLRINNTDPRIAYDRNWRMTLDSSQGRNMNYSVASTSTAQFFILFRGTLHILTSLSLSLYLTCPPYIRYQHQILWPLERRSIFAVSTRRKRDDCAVEQHEL
jgi:hypothetical protein